MDRLTVKHSNPKGLFDAKFYSQVVTVPRPFTSAGRTQSTLRASW